MDKPEDGRPLQPDSDCGCPAWGHKVMKGNEMSEEDVSGLKQRLLLGSNDRAVIDTVISSTGDADLAMDRVRGRKSRFLGELLEAKRSVEMGGVRELLEIAQGRYDGYVKDLGQHASR